jgi:hypothetical protein
MLALLAAGLVLTYFARIELTTSGLALVDPHKSTFVAVLPAIAASDLQGQRPLRLEVSGPAGRHDVAALALHAEPAEDGDIQRAGFTSFSRPAVLVTGILPPGAMSSVEVSSVRLTARAVVVLGSRRAFVALLHGVWAAPRFSDSYYSCCQAACR